MCVFFILINFLILKNEYILPLELAPISNAILKYLLGKYCGDSVQFSRSVVSDSLRPHELQHARPPCSSPTPGVHSNSCPKESEMQYLDAVSKTTE